MKIDESKIGIQIRQFNECISLHVFYLMDENGYWENDEKSHYIQALVHNNSVDNVIKILKNLKKHLISKINKNNDSSI